MRESNPSSYGQDVLATVLSATLRGIDGRLIRVEVDVAPGLPGFTIVGLPDAALQEARERVRGAIRNSGLAFPPRRITVNLAPADLRKAGASLDVGIAIGILVGSEQVRAAGHWAFIGELSLGGELRSIPGVLPMVAALARRGVRRVVVPAEAEVEARLVPGIECLPAATLADTMSLVQAGSVRRRTAHRVPDRVELAGGDQTEPGPRSPGRFRKPSQFGGASMDQRHALDTWDAAPDLAEVRGQAVGRRALEIALAGGHGLVLSGPPGSGKTLLARTVPRLLAPLDDQEAFLASMIASAAGAGPLTELVRQRPFRAPHHTISYAGMIGGGPHLGPGEVTKANDGILFLDELPEFGRDVLEALRQPMEDGRVSIVRAGGSVVLPARFQLLAAMNPCPCGGAAGPDGGCNCNPGAPERYAARVSGPLRDRIDMWADMPGVLPGAMVGRGESESSRVVAERILAARVRAQRRRHVANARLSGRALRSACGLAPDEEAAARAIASAARLSARGTERLLRVSRTIADLDESEDVLRRHLEEAARFRMSRGPTSGALAA